MRKTLLGALLLLSACASPPPTPSPEPCAGLVPNCDEKKIAGLPASRTVQLMVQSPMLIGGKPADPAEWPASVYAKAGSSACSATLVGERTVFMAAHCMDNGATISFNAHANAYKGRCTHHPEYRGNDTADWALCLVDRPVTGVPFEFLGHGAALSLKATLTLSGYGCVKPGGGGGNDGIFRIGLANITGLPSGKSYDIVTKGGAALCFGDSGGAAYAVNAKGERAIVGVNSRGDISTMSYLPAVRTPSFVTWALQWAASANNTRVCGLHTDAMGCRGGGNPPPAVDGKFEISEKPACLKGSVASPYLDKKSEIVEAIRQALKEKE